MARFKVDRGLVKYKGKVYYQGDLLPINFTEREKHRQVYSRRLIQVEIPDEPSGIPEDNKPIDVNEGTEEISFADDLPKKEEIAATRPLVLNTPGTLASKQVAPAIKK